MKKHDDFDNYLKGRFQRAKYEMNDDGFTEEVLLNLPKVGDYTTKRNIFLMISSVLSVAIFFILGGYKSIIISVTEICSAISDLITLPSASLIVILVFLLIALFINSIIYNKSTI